MWWPFKRTEKVERRAAGRGFTAEVIAARESYIAGTSGIGELTGTAQSCVSLWENGLSMSKVQGTDMLDRRTLALMGRSLALRGESVMLIGDAGLVPCADWELSTKNGVPTAYRVSISEAGGGRTETVLAGEVLHVRIGSDPVAPWLGQAPLARAQLTAGMLHAVEAALKDVFTDSPLGSLIVPFPESPETDNTKLERGFRGKRGRIMLRESVAVSAAGGPAPTSDWKPQNVSPDLSSSMTRETLDQARDSIAMSFGCLPAMFSPQTTGPLIREGQRHLAQWTLQPIAEILAEEASDKLGDAIELDVMTPTQAFDSGGSARALATLVEAMARAKEAGLPPEALASAFRRLDWQE